MSISQDKPCDSIPRRHYSLKPPKKPTISSPRGLLVSQLLGFARTSTRTKSGQWPDWQLALLRLPRCDSNETSTGFHPWYPSFLRRNPPKHPPSLFELRRVRPSHSSMGLRPWSSAKADKRHFWLGSEPLWAWVCSEWHR